jgi:adenine deaminase
MLCREKKDVEMSEAIERRQAAAVAAGERPASVILAGGTVLEVNTGRLEVGDVAIAGRRVAAVGDVSHTRGEGTEAVDCTGLTLIPGLIDPHIHVGSSQLSVERLAEVLVPLGTAAICTDFYEPATVSGIEALTEMVSRSDGTGLYILLSPFHATALGMGAFGNTGRFSLDELVELANHERAIAIREWNFGASKIPFPQIDEFYEVAIQRRLAIEGHLEGLHGAALQASVAMGVMSDHETVAPEEAIDMIKLGVTVQIREGSGARDLGSVIRALTEHGMDSRNFSLATDEQELHSLFRDGYMDHKLRLAVAHGVPPVDVVRMATLTAANSLGVQRDFGSVAPGKVASIAAVSDLRDFDVRLMVSEGELSARDGEYLLTPDVAPYPEGWYRTIHVSKRLNADDFRFDRALDTADVRVIGISPGSLVTVERVETVQFDEGVVTSPEGLATIAVIDRHDGGERKGVGLVRGFDVAAGAVATTINPGVMNLLVFGVDPESMAAAANRVVELDGGIVVADEGHVVAEVATPLFGIMSDKPSAEVIPDAVAVADAIRDRMGVSYDGLLTSVGFACLAVIIPELKICDQGLVRVFRDRQEAVDFVVDRG